MKHKILHDPFNQIQPQVPAHESPPEPPELLSIDDPESRGGKNPRPQTLTDEGHRAKFKHEPEHTKEYDFSKRGKK